MWNSGKEGRGIVVAGLGEAGVFRGGDLRQRQPRSGTRRVSAWCFVLFCEMPARFYAAAARLAIPTSLGHRASRQVLRLFPSRLQLPGDVSIHRFEDLWIERHLVASRITIHHEDLVAAEVCQTFPQQFHLV